MAGGKERFDILERLSVLVDKKIVFVLKIRPVELSGFIGNLDCCRKCDHRADLFRCEVKRDTVSSVPLLDG